MNNNVGVMCGEVVVEDADAGEQVGGGRNPKTEMVNDKKNQKRCHGRKIQKGTQTQRTQNKARQQKQNPHINTGSNSTDQQGGKHRHDNI